VFVYIQISPFTNHLERRESISTVHRLVNI
jgi:hypothetical protein